ncbi:glycosyltransferase family 4 protein [Hymenobacter sp. GOD-10R]|uniref:glycosyltransferase family 4 protein n=1 Tax=Hymenobacter sp. GOD-10R TaxID=3093922 RepID=UPI002D78ED6A|nr:glycosyltransferase family 4 protein [Hymenobacter sp. GOD-10R]WRQ27448.1 glycosyltransferase family 4 protein [Hymenobacter sp. GOD-10R]
MKKKLRIGFLTSTDPKNRRSWSGLHYMLGQTLEKYVGEVEYLGPVSLRYLFGLGDRLNIAIGRFMQGKRYHYSISVLVSKLYAYIFRKKLKNKQFDLLFAPAAYTEFAYLHTTIPVVYCCDSTITQLIDYYEGLSRLLPVSKKELAYIEQRAISKASLLVYSSQWAANSAIQDYGASPDKVVVLPFGANFPIVLPRERVIRRQRRSECQLLFVGVEWKRKGGAIAFDTLVALRQMGVDAYLTICGCTPPAGFEHECLTVIPFLDKNDEQQLQQMVDLYLNADFFLLPTRAECAAIAFCEASSFGVPSFTTDTGGIADFVVNGVNGYQLSLEATGADFAKRIKEVFENEALYTQLRTSSRDLYEAKLNWQAWGAAMKEVLESRYKTRLSKE